MTDSDIKRINFCARVFRANGQELVVLADHRIRYQVGERIIADNLDELEQVAESILRSHRAPVKAPMKMTGKPIFRYIR